ncbi:amidohydrolase family protein [Kutzneria sp. CA-103260]|uniref:amidohydrolase family protein n=1 Tax=Kutzneria sp. CA-103260 TaxID=2802641 RepID=UPI001BA93B86|nr:amidohydrolase family protein [Kutzneria sp. CA-103260]QUQ63040.1 amidohydrolase [Kutzneria sp. CA-103260]
MNFELDDVRIFDGERVIGNGRVRVRDGVITKVAERPGAPTHTLLPGLIDAHTHVFGWADNLRQALAYGVTTELDMFAYPPSLANELCGASEKATDMAELFSAGTVVSPPGGYGSVVMPDMPTLAGPHDAEAFVAARIAEGSRYVKVVIDNGANHGISVPTLDLDTIKAVADAARARGRRTVAHIHDAVGVRLALRAGVDAVTHVPLSEVLDDDIVRLASSHVFIPTLATMEMTVGAPGGRDLARDPRLNLPERLRAAIGESHDSLAGVHLGPDADFANALESVRRLHEAGVVLLVGTDADDAPLRPAPVVHGASIHRELELLVMAGLNPVQALTAATAGPAVHFGLEDRGLIRPGRRADLLLVAGDPTEEITATRDIAAVWRQGVPCDRDKALAGQQDVE